MASASEQRSQHAYLRVQSRRALACQDSNRDVRVGRRNLPRNDQGRIGRLSRPEDDLVLRVGLPAETRQICFELVVNALEWL